VASERAVCQLKPVDFNDPITNIASFLVMGTRS
jgi:hypothetical protein